MSAGLPGRTVPRNFGPGAVISVKDRRSCRWSVPERTSCSRIDSAVSLKAVSASILTIRSCWRSSARIDPTHANRRLPTLAQHGDLVVAGAGRFVSLLRIGPPGAYARTARPTRPKVTSRHASPTTLAGQKSDCVSAPAGHQSWYGASGWRAAGSGNDAVELKAGAAALVA